MSTDILREKILNKLCNIKLKTEKNVEKKKIS